MSALTKALSTAKSTYQAEKDKQAGVYLVRTTGKQETNGFSIDETHTCRSLEEAADFIMKFQEDHDVTFKCSYVTPAADVSSKIVKAVRKRQKELEKAEEKELKATAKAEKKLLRASGVVARLLDQE